MVDFWKNKKVLITGGSGFIGRHLAESLLNLNVNLSIFTIHDIDSKNVYKKSQIEYIYGNISDTFKMHEVLKNKNYDVCFHLASQPLVEEATVNPSHSFEVNIKGTWNMLETIRLKRIKVLILASTAHVYGQNKLPYLEKYYPQPSRPYETSKACADMLAQTYADYYSLPIGIARCVNIYGPGDKHNRLVPNTILHILRNEPPEIYDSRATRDYMFVGDAVSAYLMLAEHIDNLQKRNYNIVFNFGTGKHYRNTYIINKIKNLMNSNIKPVIIKDRRQQEITQQYVSITKANKLLGWWPVVLLDEGLQQTIDWYKLNFPNTKL